MNDDVQRGWSGNKAVETFKGRSIISNGTVYAHVVKAWWIRLWILEVQAD